MSLGGPADQEALMRRALAEIRQLRARVAELEAGRDHAVAIIGIGCRYPGGGDTPENFWHVTRNGQDAIGPYPPSRLQSFTSTPAPVPDAALLGGFLADIDGFDAGFFGLSPREVRSMDPRQRLLLEVCHEALADALIPASRLAGSATGLYLGLYNDDFAQLHLRLDRPDGLDAYLGTGLSHSIAAARLSYLLDLRGPALALDAACASSLAAVHLACASLRTGESDLALAGGVNLILAPLFGMITDAMGMMAPDGRCKPFDARADGFVRSEGCGVVVLKRLADAQADGDPIRAVIHGSAMNQDGATNGITAPSGKAQQAVIRAALADATVAATDVGYVECHGTGTPLGDPVEVDALAQVYGGGRAAACALGSVKGNIGHAEAAAGIAGLIRAVLAVEKREIPAMAHFSRLNPHIELGTGLTVPIAPAAWAGGARHAAVSAFGWSGTNVHVVLGPAPAGDVVAPVDRLGAAGHLLPLSAASAEGLADLVGQVAGWLRPDTDLAALCRAAWHGRDHYRHRLVLRASTVDELATKLAARPAGTQTGPARTVLIFPGQGGQWPGMGRSLYVNDPLFRDAFQAISKAAEPFTERPLVDELLSADRFDRIDVIQPLIFAVQVALAGWLRAHGVRIDAVAGHSMGEVAAACVAGILSPTDAARIIARRSRLLRSIAGQGAMLLAELDAAEGGALLVPWRDRLSVAAINGPRTLVFSGDPDAVDALRQTLELRGTFCRPVKVDVASHSPQVDPLLPDLARELAGIVPRAAGDVTFYSTVTGGPLPGTALDAAYWGRNLRLPVRFADIVQRLRADGFGTFVEVNAHPVLAPSLRDCLDGAGHVVETLRREEGEAAALLDALGAIHAGGGVVDAAALYARRPALRFPTIGWARTDHVRPVLPVAGMVADMAEAEFHAIDWQPLPDGPLAAMGRWLLIDGGPAADDGLGAALANALSAAGPAPMVMGVSAPEKIGDAVTADDLAGCVGIVWLAGRAPLDRGDGDPVAAQEWQAVAVLRLVRHLAMLCPDGDLPPLWLVTRGAEAVETGTLPLPSGPAVGQGAMRGFLRVAATEQAGVPLRLVDLPAQPGVAEADWLARHLLAGGDEDQVALRGGRRLAARLVRCDALVPHGVPRLDPQGAYLVTGGLGGIGLRLAEQLAAWGARHLVLLGRRVPGPAAEAVLARLAAAGIAVRTFAVDVGDADALGRVLDDVRQSVPLRGIFHAAATLDDAVIDNLTPERMATVLGAKLAGAWNLHRLTLADDLGLFVLFSSAAGWLGTAGQANYAAANTAVDALAWLRLAAGLPAHAVAWGPWTDVGLAAVDARRGERLGARGLAGLSPDASLAALARLIAGPGGVWAVMRLDRDAWADHYPGSAARPFLAGAGVPSQAVSDFAKAFADATAGRQLALLSAEVASVLRTDPAKVPPDEPLRSLGLDSLMALELRNRLERLTGLRLPATLAWTCPTPALMALHLAERLRPAGTPAPVAMPVPVARLDADIDALSDEEALALLTQGGAA
ncbi:MULTISPECIES: type I polyketide synthase [unclassified Azospirillum]|uniref:type I polyketide synthase n=1 Tax=unclassified Azospirillum TaxID=2630922 RepID=UPI0011776424|nr:MULTISPECIES: type I polyketide synthase [unclassified Azospirillum]